MYLFKLWFSLDICPGVGLHNHLGGLYLVFLGTSILYFFCFIDYAKAFDCVDHNKLWEMLKEMGISDHLTCLLRNLYAAQEATVRTGYGKTDCSKSGKYVKAVYCYPAYLTYVQSTS